MFQNHTYQSIQMIYFATFQTKNLNYLLENDKEAHIIINMIVILNKTRN